jgi:hypothetical protein
MWAPISGKNPLWGEPMGLGLFSFQDALFDAPIARISRSPGKAWEKRWQWMSWLKE